MIGLLESEEIKKIQLIVNRVRPEMIELNQMLSIEDLREILVIPLLGIIPDDERIIVSTNRGEPLVLEENPSIPAMAFNNIAKRLQGEDIPYLDLRAAHDHLITRIRRLFGS